MDPEEATRRANVIYAKIRATEGYWSLPAEEWRQLGEELAEIQEGLTEWYAKHGFQP